VNKRKAMATTSNKNLPSGQALSGEPDITGGEMIRILINHPDVEMAFVHSKSNAGKFLYEIHEDLAGETDQRFDAQWRKDIDVLFLCLGHGEAKKFLEGEGAELAGLKIIDLSQDYRLHNNGVRPALPTQVPQWRNRFASGRSFVYGLPELNRELIRTAQYIANPGCFATAIQLGLLPLAKAGLLRDTEVYTTGSRAPPGGTKPVGHLPFFLEGQQYPGL